MKSRFPSLGLALLFSLALVPVAPAATKKSAATPSKKSAPARTAPKKAEPPEAPAVTANGVPITRAGSVIVVDARTGQVLHSHNADQPRPVASTQKLLTALIVAQDGNLGADVDVAASDGYCEPSMLYIKAGETYKRMDLLNILLVKSMNDVARCLARDNAGSVEAFAAKMNAKAAQLGMTNSNFANPNGLPASGQYSTARDMARVALAAYHNRTIRSIVRQTELNWRKPSGEVVTYKNTNKVLRSLSACNGMKTGYTEASGFCLISSAAASGREVIAVVLGDKRDAIWTDSYRLLAWGLSAEPIASN